MMSRQPGHAALGTTRPAGRALDHWRRAVIEACGNECHRDDEPLEDEEKVLAGHPGANMPALLTKDVRGG